MYRLLIPIKWIGTILAIPIYIIYRIFESLFNLIDELLDELDWFIRKKEDEEDGTIYLKEFKIKE